MRASRNFIHKKDMDGNISDNADDACLNITKVYAIGNDKEQVREYYDQWVNQYESDLCPERYKGPRIASEYVDRYFNNKRNSVVILDVAAGTGFVGEELSRRGFQNIEALEPSERMIERAKQKNIYNRIYCHFLTEKALPLPQRTYDCVVSSGGFGNGHIPCEALYELIRLTKQGGMIIIVMREEYLREEQYKDKLETLMGELQLQGKWKRIQRDIIPGYFMDKPGIVFVYEVL